MEDIYSNAFIKTNKAMHKANFDDSLSGTTAITIFVKGDTLYVANVGDSRAIIARENDDGKLRSHPLSIDQTPFRKDERERLKKRVRVFLLLPLLLPPLLPHSYSLSHQGARIMTLDQIEGNEEIHENWGTELGEEIDEVGDPPRVWDHTLERPGCAFTRSVGDNVAEQCGVYAEPEILVWKINSNDKFAVIASDGVFEFLTSQSVVDAIAKFANPLDAAKHVVSEAYRLWLTYDDRTDDITIIIILFENMVERNDIPTSVKHDDQRKNRSAIIISPCSLLRFLILCLSVSLLCSALQSS
jgi:serine/threonine protein phosphatase PrpC